MSLLNLQEILAGSGGLVLVALTLIQIAPIKINPWSVIVKWLGQTINIDVLRELEEMKKRQADTRERLDEHISMDDERYMDLHRARILQFNTEELRGAKHTREDFVEILYNIDCYEQYCKEHPEYKNNRAVHAIANIKRIYDERLASHNFL